MIEIEGIWWPDDVGESWRHSMRHVGSIEWSIERCKQKRVAVQAGGNIGLWPRRLGQVFQEVHTFEPEPTSRACLLKNVPPNVSVYPAALGSTPGECVIRRRGLGSHRVDAGDGVPVTTIDALNLSGVDLIQLDVEGYEWHALTGALETITRCRPIVQLELRNFTDRYGHSDREVTDLLRGHGYREVSQQPGSDYVFEWKRA